MDSSIRAVRFTYGIFLRRQEIYECVQQSYFMVPKPRELRRRVLSAERALLREAIKVGKEPKVTDAVSRSVVMASRAATAIIDKASRSKASIVTSWATIRWLSASTAV